MILGVRADTDQNPDDFNEGGYSHVTNFQDSGRLDELTKGVECLSQAVVLTPDSDPEEALRLTTLGASYTDQFRRMGELDDLDKSIEYFSRAVTLTPEGHPDMPIRFGNLGSSHTYRYQRLGELVDLERSIEYSSRAVTLTSEGHPDMPISLCNLGTSYTDRYQRLGELDDLDKSIEYFSRAVTLTPEGHPGMPLRLGNLGSSYRCRYQRLGELNDLERSIESFSRAVTLTPEGHPDMPLRLSDLGSSYTDRFWRLGKHADLEKLIEYNLRAVALTPDGHRDMPVRLGNLGTSYRCRYQRLGELDDLEKSVEYNSRAIALTSEGHPDMPRRLSNLGVSYTYRYQRLAELDDLKSSVEYNFRAVTLTSEDHPDMPISLGNLGTSYTYRYQCLGELDDLEKSIEYHSSAIALTPEGHPDMSLRLGNLGLSYADRFSRLGEFADLEQSIEYCARAVALTSEDHPDMPARLGSLGSSYLNRFQSLGELDDLKRSMECNSRALTLTPDGHPDLSSRHFNCGYSLLYQYLHSGTLDHLLSSLNSFRTASRLLTGAPQDKFKHALHWANLASEHQCLNPLEAYQTAIDLLPQFIWLGATTKQRYQGLSIAKNLAVNASFTAIQSSNHSLALEWLEQTRCVVWNQSLMVRSPLHQLRSSHPSLADRLEIAGSHLHTSGLENRAIQVTQGPTSGMSNAEQAGRQRRHLAMTYQGMLTEIRQLAGFGDFLQPTKLDQLFRAVRNGPVVVINCHTDRCDALIILPSNNQVRHLPLPNFTQRVARRAQADLLGSLREKQLRGIRFFQEQKHEDSMGRILKSLWRDIVQPVLIFLGYMDGVPREQLPHITWCPTGPLAFLPLHAAGDYSHPRSRVFDYVISSYTPTLSALLASTPSSLNYDCRVLAVGQAATPGCSPLPGTTKELELVQTHTHNKAEYTQLVDSQATATAVLDAMEHHDWVHLACHAHQNVKDPTKSGFYLHDGILDLTAINQRSLRNKGLAFLSACQTAAGDEELPDEAIHLASGMLMAGYSSVIATMWSVVDEDAPFVADKVYAQLLEGGKLGNGEAGRALHDAVARLREKVGEDKFGRWVPYIHFGS
ncbi:unnamed protein product [Rhizoctonia solani]|uniref:CHAT domain-containing protein n=1 Tax=Rhizoctonia solani TaxID=456999 RepID=A0A8H3HV62_9AGAM|nr:unnamed protein product [Rhizoctonia solani]